MSDKDTVTRYFRVKTDEVRGGYKKERSFVATVTKDKDEPEGSFYGYCKYLYHQTIRGVLGYTDCSVGDKHTLVKQGNTVTVESIDEISKTEYLDAKNAGVKELTKQQ